MSPPRAGAIPRQFEFFLLPFEIASGMTGLYRPPKTLSKLPFRSRPAGEESRSEYFQSWGRGCTAAGVFFSRRPAPLGAGRSRTGLRPPKGYGRSGRTVRYGPQAGEGSVARCGGRRTRRSNSCRPTCGEKLHQRLGGGVRFLPLPSGAGDICGTWTLQVPVIPAKAGIHRENLPKSIVDGLDSRFRGNDPGFQRNPNPNGGAPIFPLTGSDVWW
jgi:hypothetical protein